MIGRRKFLKVLGIGTASSPIAAKVAAEQEIAKLTALRGWDRPPLHIGPVTSRHDGIALMNAAHPVLPDTMSQARTYMRAFGMPAYVEARIRDETKYVNHLDVDIATKKSWSLAYKIVAQRQRNFDNEVARRMSGDWLGKAHKAFFDKTGFSWPW